MNSLHDVINRKVKMLKKARFALGKVMELPRDGGISGKAMENDHGLKMIERVDMNHQSRNLIKIQNVIMTPKNSYLWKNIAPSKCKYYVLVKYQILKIIFF